MICHLFARCLGTVLDTLFLLIRYEYLPIAYRSGVLMRRGTNISVHREPHPAFLITLNAVFRDSGSYCMMCTPPRLLFVFRH